MCKLREVTQTTNLLLWLVELGWNSTHPLLLVRIPENVWSIITVGSWANQQPGQNIGYNGVFKHFVQLSHH